MVVKNNDSKCWNKPNCFSTGSREVEFVMLIPQKDNSKYVQKYQREGLNVIPCKEREKLPAINWKEYQNQVYREDIPSTANIAIICGRVSGNLVVVDVDKSDIDLVNQIYPDALKKTRVVKTGSGGYHIYFRVPELPKRPLRLNKENGDHIDVQVNGTYVLVPPSIHPNGHEYRIVSKTEGIKNLNFREIIANLEKAGFKVKQTEKESLEELSKSGIEKGNRHNSALRYCNLLLFTQELDPQTVRFEMGRWNLKLKPPLPDEEIDRVVDDCVKFHKENKTTDGAENEGREPKGFHKKIAESIMSKYNFRTLYDTEEILVYEHGVYRPYGKIKIKEECQIEKKECYNNLVSEVIGTVQRLTYTHRERFDGYLNLVNLENGILDIEKNQLLPHNPQFLFRVQLPIEFKPNSKPEKIMKFLDEVLDPEFREWVLDFIAYCLVRNCKQEKALMMVGFGGNGKSTLLNLIIKFLGMENISTHSISELIYNRFAKADLDGKLANIHSDIESDEVERTGILKQLISGDPISVEKKNQDAFTMKAFTKLIFSTNQMPDVKEEPEAFFQRWLVIDFVQMFRGTDRENKNLIDELTTDEELSGLLNIVMERMPRLISNSGVFKNAPSGYELKQTWKDHANSVESFINNQIEFDKNSKIVKKDLFKIYLMYCKEKKFKSVSDKTFSSRINKSLGDKIKEDVGKINGKSVRLWKNIRVKNIPSVKGLKEDENQQKLDSDSHSM